MTTSTPTSAPSSTPTPSPSGWPEGSNRHPGHNAWSNRLVRLFIVFFVLCLVATAFWGWWIVQGVRRTADRTDVEIRTIGWATLAYAASHDGVFPPDAASLARFGTGTESIAIAPPEKGSEIGFWPVSRAEALRGAEPAQLDVAFKTIVVTWGTEPGMPPYLKPDGLPTKVGTNVEVNGWLDSFRKHVKLTGSAR